MILYINSCVRRASRTHRLAAALLERLGPYTEVTLARETLQGLTEETLAFRDACVAAGDFSDPMFRFARQFARADTIVISAPYWDFSFPALLKTYLENICVTGLTFRYTPEGRPEGLCRAGRLYYVTTAGGPYRPDFSYDQLRTLAQQYFGIPETHLVCAECLDMAGSDPEEILAAAIAAL
jgi:FMN-dependent NADH-azoreductase